MIGLPAGTKVWLVAGVTDMRRGFDGLASNVQSKLAEDPFSGHVFVFRGRKGDRLKVLWWSGDGMCLLAKRLEHGHFVWPSAESGAVYLTQAQIGRASCRERHGRYLVKYRLCKTHSLPLLIRLLYGQ